MRRPILLFFVSISLALAAGSNARTPTSEEYEQGRGHASFFVRGFATVAENGISTLILYSLTNERSRLRQGNGRPLPYLLLYTSDADLLRVLNQHIVVDAAGIATDVATYLAKRPMQCELVRVTAEGKIGGLESASARMVKFVK